MSLKQSVIVGVGHYLPQNVVTNDDLSQVVDTSDEWIFSRTGIRQRHFAAEGELTSDLGTAAANEALKAASLIPADVDLIVVATATPDDTFPATATTIQKKLGCPPCLAFDVAAACSGYLLALQTADNALRVGQAKTALVIGAETFSRILDMNDRRTCVLFGDGAGAVVLQAQDATDRGVKNIIMKSDGQYRDILHTSGGIASTKEAGVIQMNGKEVFRHAVTKMSDACEEVLQKSGLTQDEVDWLIPHQANIRIIEGVGKRFSIPADRVIATVDKHANTSAASIPLALYEGLLSGKLKQGDLILHSAIGSGLVWGAGLVRL